MAYMNQEKKKSLAPQIKAILKKYKVKGTLSVNNLSSLVLTIKESPWELNTDYKYESVNTYWIDDHYSGAKRDFLNEVADAMNGKGSKIANHDRSDVMTDYFDVGWYIDIQFGSWNKEYKRVA